MIYVQYSSWDTKFIFYELIKKIKIKMYLILHCICKRLNSKINNILSNIS